MTHKETSDELLQKIYVKLRSVLPDTIYVPAENAKYLELIASDRILFIATEGALDESMEDLLMADFVDKADKRSVIYRADGDKFYSKETMVELEKRLSPDPNFMRTHISFIANLREARGIQRVGERGYALVVRNSDKLVPISQVNLKAVRGYFGIAE
jgi:hypothetical protein